jgi:hypothetical protein
VCDLTGLQPRAMYRFAVAASNGAGLGPYSATAAVTTTPSPDGPPKPPLAPTPVDAPNCTSIMLQLPPLRGGS